MAQWVVAYCRKAVASVRKEDCLHALEEADLYTLAETLDLDEDEVDEAERQFRFEPASSPQARSLLEFHYNAKGRPISIWLYPPESVREQVAEALEELPEAARVVRDHLARTRDVVAFELGLSQLDTIAEILAQVLAYGVAESFDGIVDFYGNEWYSPADRGTPLWPQEGEA